MQLFKKLSGLKKGTIHSYIGDEQIFLIFITRINKNFV